MSHIVSISVDDITVAVTLVGGLTGAAANKIKRFIYTMALLRMVVLIWQAILTHSIWLMSCLRMNTKING